MEVDQLAHRVHVIVGVAQGLHALAGHAGAHHLVVVERHPAVDEGPRPGLADVVEQGGQPQEAVRGRLVHHGQGVGQHVLVAVDGVLLEGQAWQLGQELLGQAGADHEPQGHRRHRHHHDLVELVADPLGRHDGQAPVTGPHGVDQSLVGLEAEPGREPGRPQHAQGVVGKGDLRIQRRPQPPGGQVGQAAEGVDQLEVGKTQGHGVDGEVPADEVVLDAVAEGHLGLAGVGVVGLGPVGGDLVLLVPPLAGDGAEPLALGPHRIGPARHHGLDLVGPGVGGEVQVGIVGHTGGGVAGDDGVTHRAAHQIEGPVRPLEPLRQVGRGVDQGPESLGEHAAEGSAADVGCGPTWTGNEPEPAPRAARPADRDGAGATAPADCAGRPPPGCSSGPCWPVP